MVPRPDRVSPWELEPLAVSNSQPSPQPPARNKRARPPASSSIAPELPPVYGMFLLRYCYRLCICFKVIASTVLAIETLQCTACLSLQLLSALHV